MKQLETGDEKVQKICNALKKETLEPAVREAAQIVEEGKRVAQSLIESARQSIEKMERDAAAKIEEERNVFNASLSLASKQALETLKQEIEERLFSDELSKLIQTESSKQSVVVSLIATVISAIEKEGIDGNVAALVAKSVDPKKVSEELAKEVLSKLTSVTLGEMTGGAKLVLEKHNLTISLTDDVLAQLLGSFLRDDFRKILFGEEMV